MQTNDTFSTEWLSFVKIGDISYQPLDGSNPWTISAKVKMRVSESEAWLMKIDVFQETFLTSNCVKLEFALFLEKERIFTIP